MMRLEGKIAVVTGGGRGIGAEICTEFAREGAIVTVTDLDDMSAKRTAREISGSGGKADSWSFDVTDGKVVDDTAGEIEERLGSIDIWVNNAGISKVVPFLDCSEELWDLTMRVNLKGAFLGCRAAIKRMLPRKRGVILNMSSQSGKTGSSNYQAYCASKFGIIGLTQSLAVEFAGHGIRVNTLCPGVVFTPLWDEQLADYAEKRNMKPEEVKPYLESRIPMGRLCTPGDVAKAAVFLAGDDASYITGQCFRRRNHVLDNRPGINRKRKE